MSKNKLVWSDDPRDQQRLIDENSKPKIKQDGAEFVESTKWTAVFRIEKGGRGGKIVTVIDQLPRQDDFLKKLCKELKAKCGAGGKYEFGPNGGLIEIQGDKRDAIKLIFEKKGIRYKGM
jgi:translation initiation factor 1